MTRRDVRVLVVCPVHDPRDARISERQIGALLDAGHEVTQVAPFSAYGALPRPGVRGVDIARSVGRRRSAGVRQARRAMRREASGHDIIILHSPDAALAATGVRHPMIVWDVHEDVAASLEMKPWLPRFLARPAGSLVRWGESSLERRWRVMLAETAYSERFAGKHPVVPNYPHVPDRVPLAGRGRAIYVGRLTRARGARELVELGRMLVCRGIALDIIGNSDPEVAEELGHAQEAGWIRWHGFVPNAEALDLVEGATVGISLLHDEANYRHSMPTKLLEYLARGVPFVSTPLPLAQDLANASGSGVIVPFGDVAAACDAVTSLDRDDERREAMGRAGHAWMREGHDWGREGAAFVAILESWLRESRRDSPS